MKTETDKKMAEMYISGLSMKQVSDLLGVSFCKVKYSLQKHSITRRNRQEASRLLHITKFGRKTCTLKKNLSDDENLLKIAGTMLYWGEGTKQGSSVVFSNSNPEMIKVFLQFLRNVCGISDDRLRILLHLYPDHDEASLKEYWSKVTSIPLDQFSKTYYHNGSKGLYKKKSQFGTASLRYSDKELLRTINGWITNYQASIAQW